MRDCDYVKVIHLTRGFEAIVDDDDFDVLSHFRWQCDAYGYASRGIWHNGKTDKVLMHRIILNAPKGIQVDHVDGNRLNNQRSNLRLATISQQRWNQGLHHDNKTGFKGVQRVSRHKSKPFVARIGRMHLGYFGTAEEAARRYDIEAVKIFGEYARTNSTLCQLEN